MSRRPLDMGRLAALAQRPGADPRIWVTFAIVREVIVSEDGVLANVKYVPTGEEETAYVATPYAGAEFGMWTPLEIDDVVLVVVPLGDANYAPVVLGRLWKTSDKPFAEIGDSGTAPTADVLLKVKPGQKFTAVASDDGSIELLVLGNQPVKIVAGGVVEMQDASQAFVRGNDFADALGTYLDAQVTLLTALSTFFTGLNTVLSAVFPPITALVTTVNAAITAATTATNTFKAARTQYLSTKVKGQ